MPASRRTANSTYRLISPSERNMNIENPNSHSDTITSRATVPANIRKTYSNAKVTASMSIFLLRKNEYAVLRPKYASITARNGSDTNIATNTAELNRMGTAQMP